jgi:voltage-gated potassium channel
MDFLREAGTAAILITLTLSVHCGGMAAVINWGIAHFSRTTHRLGPFRSARLIVRLTGVMMSLHLSEIVMWGAFYRWYCFPSWDSAFYFSITSYSTVGYGDVILRAAWRNLGPVESVAGVLMCGLSASFLFAIVTRLVDRETQHLRALLDRNPDTSAKLRHLPRASTPP